MAALQRIDTHCVCQKDNVVGASEQPEGTSPTASASSSLDGVEYYTGHLGGNQHCAQLSRPRRRGALSWVVRSLYRLQGKQRDQDKEDSFPSGGSYDSLISLDDNLLVNTHQWRQQQQHHHQQQQQQERQQQSHIHAQPPCIGLGTSSVGPTAVDEQRPVKGFFRRLAKAVLRPIVRLVMSAAAHASPQGPGTNDNSTAERIINVITSIPFCIIGAYGLRKRLCPKGRHFSLAFMAVGVVAASYHGISIRSPVRPFLRKLDYYTICYTSTVLRRAAQIKLPSVVSLAAVLVAPVTPTAVTGLNLVLVEGQFLRHALTHAHLRPSFKLHLTTAVVGIGFFAFEDVATALGWPAILHSLWHCLSAMAMGCTNSLLHHLEMALLVEGVQLQTSALQA